MNMIAELSRSAEIISKDEFNKLDLDDLAHIEIAQGAVCVAQIMGTLKYAVYYVARREALTDLGHERTPMTAATIMGTEQLGIHVFGFLSDAMMLAGAAAAGIMIAD